MRRATNTIKRRRSPKKRRSGDEVEGPAPFSCTGQSSTDVQLDLDPTAVSFFSFQTMEDDITRLGDDYECYHTSTRVTYTYSITPLYALLIRHWSWAISFLLVSFSVQSSESRYADHYSNISSCLQYVLIDIADNVIGIVVRKQQFCPCT